MCRSENRAYEHVHEKLWCCKSAEDPWHAKGNYCQRGGYSSTAVVYTSARSLRYSQVSCECDDEAYVLIGDAYLHELKQKDKGMETEGAELGNILVLR